MKLYISDIKLNTVVFTISNHKIQPYFVKGIKINENKSILEKDFSHSVILELDMYNDGINSAKNEERLSNCYLTKEDLINQL